MVKSGKLVRAVTHIVINDLTRRIQDIKKYAECGGINKR